MGNNKCWYFAFLVLGVGLGAIIVILVNEVRPRGWASDSTANRHPKVMLKSGQVVECTPDSVARWLTAERRLAEVQADLARAHDTIADLETRIQRFEATVADAEAPPTGSASPDVVSETASEDSTADESPEDKKMKELKALLSSIDWEKMAAAIHAWIKAQRDARKSGRPPKFDPALLSELSRTTITMSQIAELLGLENEWAVWENELVVDQFMPAYLKALGVELTDAQRAAFLTWLKTQPSLDTSDIEMDVMGNPRTFDSLLKLAEREIQFTDWIRYNLTPAQYSAYCSAVENDLFYGQEIPTRRFKASTEAEAAQSVAQHWQQIYQADVAQANQLSQIANQFVQDYYAITYSYTRLYGNQMPRHVSLEMQMKLLQLQNSVEQQCRALFPDAPQDTVPTIIVLE